MLNFLFGGGGAASRMNASDAIEKAAKGEIVIIDVRDGNELRQTGKAKGAVHIPMATVRFRTDPRNPDFDAALSVDKPVAIYCASGARSQMAVQVLKNHGFEEVYNLGSFMEWASAGGQVVRA
ncbi:MAG: rhodanese-like domain-containing protein [Brevirhabdus sp.]